MKKLSSLFAIALLIFSSHKLAADTPSTHGMLLFGDRVTYASHLPMFHAPHDYQLIMKLKFSDQAPSETLRLYEEAKEEEPSLFTLVPERMDLSEVVSGQRTEFSAVIY